MTESFMTKQDIFDTVAKHLFAQGERSMLPGGSPLCAYRGQGDVTGRPVKCAVGVLMSDDEYEASGAAREESFGGSIGVAELGGVRAQWLRPTTESLLSALQYAHDTGAHWDSPTTLKEALRDVGERKGLDVSILDGLAASASFPERGAA